MSATISEIIRRSEQGVTRPFLCRSTSGRIYFVKGSGTGKDGLRAEWLAGCLARTLALPIPDFELMEVPQALIFHSAVEGIGELRAGIAFGSAVVSGAQEITFAQSQKLDMYLRAKVLLFDWWVQNGDRTLTALGGNPNLLCTGHEPPTLWVIDNHGAFDAELETSKMWSLHVFRESRQLWTSAFIGEILPRLQQVASQLPAFWAQMPEEWCPEGDAASEASLLELDRLATILNRPLISPDPFWNGVL